jgi:hypothetical protein
LAAGHRLEEGMVDCVVTRPNTAAKPIMNVMPLMAELKLAISVILHVGGKCDYIAADRMLSC